MKIEFVRRIVALTLIVCYMAGIFSPFIVIAGYLLHRDYITASLCVNKSEPLSTCHGSCYLAKELADTTEPFNQQSNTEQSLTVLSPHEIHVDLVFTDNEQILPVKQFLKLIPPGNAFHTEVFSPPERYV